MKTFHYIFIRTGTFRKHNQRITLCDFLPQDIHSAFQPLTNRIKSQCFYCPPENRGIPDPVVYQKNALRNKHTQGEGIKERTMVGNNDSGVIECFSIDRKSVV